jgi:hypothetical protein
MALHPLLPVLRGPFHFLRPTPDELIRLVPDVDRTLPVPPRIFFDNEDATPLRGFPILVSGGLVQLKRALEGYVLAEERAQMAIQARQPFNRKAHALAWDRYRTILSRAVENVTLSSYGRHYPAVFWLHHSLWLASLLKETPRRLLRLDTELGRRHGDTVKYRVLERYLERVVDTCYDLVSSLAQETEEAEDELFPRVLTRLRDNVLVLTEDHVSHDLAELSSYFNGYLRIDGRDFRRRFDELTRWHQERWQADPGLRRQVRLLLEGEPDPAPLADPQVLLRHRGYVSFLATLKGYDERQLFDADHRRVWESLLERLKEFELYHAVRRRLRLVALSPDGTLETKEGGRRVQLSPATRPLDFLAPWVVDPLVDRFGLVYDLTDFSAIVSYLRRSGSTTQDASFRKMFRFQRRINQLAQAHKMTLEKYLGDGAFYSSRHAAALVGAAIRIQRLYRQELSQGFPFDRGLRLALNYGQYRLIPIGGGGPGQPERYEFFGHGLVELSRLSTGKAAREIDEIKTLLVSQGYDPEAVDRFFAPMLRQDVDVVERTQEGRRFRAYINRNMNLINEGIVTTAPLLERLEREAPWDELRLGRAGDRAYVVFRLASAGAEVSLGVRGLGRVRLKGLDEMEVYEVIDGEELTGGAEATEPLLERSLSAALARLPQNGGGGLSESTDLFGGGFLG